MKNKEKQKSEQVIGNPERLSEGDNGENREK